MSSNHQTLSRRLSRTVFAGFAVTALSGTALAYRPFDGTDPAVAKLGEVEIELAPADLFRERSMSTVIAPFTILNLGIAPDWEAVFSDQGQFPQSDDSSSIGNVSAFLKRTLCARAFFRTNEAPPQTDEVYRLARVV
jgi:hypothetical protein